MGLRLDNAVGQAATLAICVLAWPVFEIPVAAGQPVATAGRSAVAPLL
jgi:hypothetical protein